MGVIGFFIGVSIVSLVLYVLMLRADRACVRRAYAGPYVSDSASVGSSNDSFSLLGWLDGSSSASSSDSCSSFSSSSDSSSGDGGGGDGGGGD